MNDFKHDNTEASLTDDGRKTDSQNLPEKTNQGELPKPVQAELPRQEAQPVQEEQPKPVQAELPRLEEQPVPEERPKPVQAVPPKQEELPKPVQAELPRPEEQPVPEERPKPVQAEPLKSEIPPRQAELPMPVQEELPAEQASAGDQPQSASHPQTLHPRMEQLVLAQTLNTQQVQKRDVKQGVVVLERPNESYAAILQRKRSEANVSIREVSAKTRLSVTFITDMENASFRQLPDLEQCQAKLELLCQEYDIPTEPILDKFTQEYEAYRKSQEEDVPQAVAKRHPPRRSRMGDHQGLDTSAPKFANLPSILILAFILILVAVLAYAFLTYNANKMPETLDVDLTEHVPLHTPKTSNLDDIKR